mgnify:CR=1 FL=1
MQTMRNSSGTASKVADISKLKWSDEKWMEARAAHKMMRCTVSQCPFMKCIRVPGNVMQAMRKTPAFIHTVNWQ